jgi:hypothetical protein
MDTLGMQRRCREDAENVQRRYPILVMEAENEAFRAVPCFCNATSCDLMLPRTFALQASTLVCD